jgi:LCP family protein required for cell wall assembly
MPNLDAIIPNTNHFPHHDFAPKPKKSRRRWKRLFFVLIFLAAIGFGGFQLLAKTNKIFSGKQNIFQRIGSLLISPDKPLTGETDGQINILLLGVGGNGHDGGYLTDTMIVASINTQTSEIVLTSVPRDFAINLPKLGYNKINAAYAYAYRDSPDTAGNVAIAAAEQVTGFKIPYFAVVDFQGFVKAINDVGGVNVTVDHTFTDNTFPNDYPFDTKGYIAPVTFVRGQAHMDGGRALIFARSRHSENANEGSDFARSERQKKILIALKEKILALNLTDLKTINNLLSDFTENFRTNLEPYELKHLSGLAKTIDSNKIYSLSLEPQDNLICSALVDPKTGLRVPDPIPVPASTDASQGGPTPTPAPTPAPTIVPEPTAPPTVPEIIRMYVVQPCEGKTLADIHNFLLNSSELAKLKKEAAVVDVQNSTNKAYPATKYKQLADMGSDVRFATFLGKVPYDQTILYDNSHGSKPNTLNYLKKQYNLTTSDINYTSSSADFVIVIGKDSL